MPEISIAAICVLASVEISIPSDSATKINSIDSAVSQKRLPATGTCSTKTDSNRIVMRFTHERVK